MIGIKACWVTALRTVHGAITSNADSTPESHPPSACATNVPKTATGSFHIRRSRFQKVPKREIRKLIDRHILIFAPGKNFNGLCLDLRAYEEDRVFIYLSPDLTKRPADQVRHTIAHELAHAVLRHSEEPSPNAAMIGELQERQADELAARWGFPKPVEEATVPEK